MRERREQLFACVLIPLALLAVMAAAMAFTGQWPWKGNPYNSYVLQACSWLEGRLDLGRDYPWLELAIHEGKYYVSFPPFPSYVLLPFAAVFGTAAPDGWIAVVCSLLGMAAGWFGGLLNICPLLNMDDHGRLIPREKARGKRRVIKMIVDRMAEHAEGGEDYSGKCYISNSACMADARAVADLVEARFPRLNGKVEIYSVGTTIGSHTGPGTVALFFWGDERVR